MKDHRLTLVRKTRNEQYDYNNYRECPRDVMVKELDCGTVVSKFEHQWC